jgi:hypothetical protein
MRPRPIADRAVLRLRPDENFNIDSFLNFHETPEGIDSTGAFTCALDNARAVPTGEYSKYNDLRI